MTLQSILAAALQLAGVFLFCDVLGTGMGFLSFSGSMPGQGASADWVKIWSFNMAFWMVGATVSLTLIFAAGRISSLLCRISSNRPNAVLSHGLVSSDLIVQLFAVFLLIREVNSALNQAIWTFTRLEAERAIGMALYYAATIGISLWLLRHPDALGRFRKRQDLPKPEQGRDGSTAHSEAK
ncbi:MAG: hypothetical protein MUF31_05185 [Akkermansiaceae bacterium]|jgi:hypothetical protein|nr:hypothetical protein [Akkermansiaceae bacterium]